MMPKQATPKLSPLPPFDPACPTVHCRRAPTGVIAWAGTEQTYCDCNVPRAVTHHSIDGYEWGYGGSGPSDLALNVLHQLVPPGADGLPPVRCRRGICGATAWALHQSFKRAFVAPLPYEGGVIDGGEILAWLFAERERLADAGFYDDRDGEGGAG